LAERKKKERSSEDHINQFHRFRRAINKVAKASTERRVVVPYHFAAAPTGIARREAPRGRRARGGAPRHLLDGGGGQAAAIAAAPAAPEAPRSTGEGGRSPHHSSRNLAPSSGRSISFLLLIRDRDQEFVKKKKLLGCREEQPAA
jgi:hypothetical protein